MTVTDLRVEPLELAPGIVMRHAPYEELLEALVHRNVAPETIRTWTWSCVCEHPACRGSGFVLYGQGLDPRGHAELLVTHSHHIIVDGDDQGVITSSIGLWEHPDAVCDFGIGVEPGDEGVDEAVWKQSVMWLLNQGLRDALLDELQHMRAN